MQLLVLVCTQTFAAMPMFKGSHTVPNNTILLVVNGRIFTEQIHLDNI